MRWIWVCRILDYGKFKYEQKKKARGKPKSTASVVKEIRVRPKIDTNDVDIKVRKAREFLDAGNKVQVTCLFRGREMAYKNLGRDVLDRVVELLADIAKVERLPRMEGRRMNLLLSRKTLMARACGAGKTSWPRSRIARTLDSALMTQRPLGPQTRCR